MNSYSDSIAIIGIACRFPGADTKDEFWENLINNKETITNFDKTELEKNEFNFNDLASKYKYVNARGVIKDIDKWDAKFFNISPGEAKLIDPQQRVWLENTWHAFEDSGYNPFTYSGNIGVYVSSFFNTYLLNNILREREKYELYIRGYTPEIFQTFLSSDPAFLATKTAYFFNLRGPALNIQTACSSSLVTVVQACNSLLLKESDMCVAGGVTISVPQERGYIYLEGAIASPDGHCRPFEKDSNGTVFGNGVGTVILKRLDDAIKDNDRIYAVIRGWANNNDGNIKVGYTAPGIEGQKNVITKAQSMSKIPAEDFKYIETHGTATALGDRIEFTALSKAFDQKTTKKQFCGIGSVKSNIGHLDAAAGIAGLIKIALSAFHKQVPATVNFKTPNPQINFKNSPFFMVDKNLTLDSESPVFMGVSSFGIGGTNAHVVISDYKQTTEKQNSKINRPVLFQLSAVSEKSLEMQKENLKHFIENNPECKPLDIAYSLNRRKVMPMRSFAVYDKKPTTSSPLIYSDFAGQELNSLVYMFPGQGAQYFSMGRNLYETESYFQLLADKCFDIYQNITGTNLKDILFSEDKLYNENALSQTQITQPALFIVEYCIAMLYKSYGIVPQYCIGHSIGEYVAACYCGVFDLESALSIVIKRGALMQTMPKGNMMAVNTTREELNNSDENFEIAAINSPLMATISFQPESAATVNNFLKTKEIRSTMLNTSHAFHSKAFDPILDEFEEYVGRFNTKTNNIPFISCLTGDFITKEQASSPKYWASQLRHSVQFSKGIDTICEKSNSIFLEVGPNTHLSSFVKLNHSVKDKKQIIQSLGKPDDRSEQIHFYSSLGELLIRGIKVSSDKFFEDRVPALISLPPYPFEKNVYWTESKVNNSFVSDESEYVLEESEPDFLEGVKNKEITNTEKILLGLWAKYLGTNEINVEDNFFEIGGNSLLTISLVKEIEDKFKVGMNIRSFFSSPRIKELAELIDIKIGDSGGNSKNVKMIEGII
jgi:phthiocerol/phenolphthiocerol synthesis type-I polyketide synthase E